MTTMTSTIRIRRSVVRMGSLAIVLIGGAGCQVAVGDKAPNWMLYDADRTPYTMEHFRGKVVVLDFWATWCGPCVAASPHIQALHEKFADNDVAVVGIHYDDMGDPAAYMKKNDYTFLSLEDGQEAVKRFGVSKIPTIIVVDQQGFVAHRQMGFSEGDEQKIADVVEGLLAS